jgi:CHASE3 domain sensor protein
MKIGRPRTLLSMVLMGLFVVAVPLLVAVGNAMFRLGALATESEVVLTQSATATLQTERLTNLLASMERNARNYVTLKEVASSAAPSNTLASYDRDQADFDESVSQMRVLPSDPPILRSSSASACSTTRHAPSRPGCARRRTRVSRSCRRTRAPRSRSSCGSPPR